MKDYYKDKQGFKDQIRILEDNLEELEKFSAWQNDIASEELAEISKLIERIKMILKGDPKCPKCGKSNLTETKNTFGDFVFQRIVGCDECGYVYSFNANPNWREEVEEDELFT